jgi:succinyl-CoA synthetase beta subunit
LRQTIILAVNAPIIESAFFDTGPNRSDVLSLARKLKFSPAATEEAANQMIRLYDMFISNDVTLLEINPLAETPSNTVIAADAKIVFDENAAFRQEDIFKLRDETQEDSREVAASKYNLNYIGLDGNIGCMVNGAGLAMATMDIINQVTVACALFDLPFIHFLVQNGQSPANFLDVGGSANESQVTEAFKILQSDPRVSAILVNIFGGIMKCDTIANGIVAAARKVNLRVPLVVRLEGTNVALGRDIIANSGLPISTASSLDEAAKLVCTLAKK